MFTDRLLFCATNTDWASHGGGEGEGGREGGRERGRERGREGGRERERDNRMAVVSAGHCPTLYVY